jgi:hypothetical protein
LSNTPIFDIEELPASSSQPEIYVNTAIRILECMAQLVILDRDLTTAPESGLTDGDVYYIGGTGAGDWAGHNNQLALYIGTAWRYVTPRQGWTGYIEDEDLHVKYVDDSSADWEAL